MAEENKRFRGTVKWFNAWKGFGFITPYPDPDITHTHTSNNTDTPPDLFVQHTSIRFDGFRTLYDGQRVDFQLDLAQDRRTRATDVVPLGSSRRRSTSTGVVECYNCARLGHFARDCYATATAHYSGTRGRGRGRRGIVDCFNCGEEGHFARDCPN